MSGYRNGVSGNPAAILAHIPCLQRNMAHDVAARDWKMAAYFAQRAADHYAALADHYTALRAPEGDEV